MFLGHLERGNLASFTVTFLQLTDLNRLPIITTSNPNPTPPTFIIVADNLQPIIFVLFNLFFKDDHFR